MCENEKLTDWKTDNYDYYHGGKFVFLRWRGIDVPSQNL